MSTPAEIYASLVNHLREAAILGSCSALLGWDERTYLPRAGAEFRGEQGALLARLIHERMTSPRIGEWLTALESSEINRGDTPEAANLREIRRNYNRAVKLPPRLVEELARVTLQSQGAWQEARQHNRYADFQPWFDTILALKREEAQAVGYEGHPYNALLDEYEPGVNVAQIEAIFADLSQELVQLIQKIADSEQKPSVEILQREYPVAAQQSFGEAVAGIIGFDFNAGRLDVTTHPFCSGIAPGDCRITTRYNPKFFNESFFGILHEAGHGIYEQGLNPAHFGTPLGTAASLGIHESQSRLWENQIGRSKVFWKHFFPQAQQRFGQALHAVSLDEWYFAINEAKPSFIRVEADEATYNLHIILRFELEKSLLTGDLSTKDLPHAWNEKFQKMLGLTPPSDQLGCLQDIHWSMGGLGYFPTYTLGNLYSAQFMEQIRRDLPDLDSQIQAGEFKPLKQWLNAQIHTHGMRYRAPELCQRITGTELSHGPLMNYLQSKYAELYGFNS